MPDRPDNPMNEIKMITLDELTSSMSNYAKAEIAKQRIEQLETAGNRLAFLMLNGSTEEMRKAIWGMAGACSG
jgi:hypothetical protein